MINCTLYYSCSAADVNLLRVPDGRQEGGPAVRHRAHRLCMVPGWIFGSAVSCMLPEGLNVSGNSGPACNYAADVNLLEVPDELDDKKVVLLSDIMPTGWHGARLANVEKGSRVAVWGCGPGVRLALQQSSRPFHTFEPMTSDTAAEPACSTGMRSLQALIRDYAVICYCPPAGMKPAWSIREGLPRRCLGLQPR